MPRPPADHWITPPCRGTEGITARSLLVHPERTAEQRDDLHAQLGPVLGQCVQSPERAISVRSTSTSELGSTTPPAGSVPTSRTHFASGCTSGSTPRGQLPGRELVDQFIVSTDRGQVDGVGVAAQGAQRGRVGSGVDLDGGLVEDRVRPARAVGPLSGSSTRVCGVGSGMRPGPSCGSWSRARPVLQSPRPGRGERTAALPS